MNRFRTPLLLPAVLFTCASAFAQPNTTKPADSSTQTTAAPRPTRTFYLKYVTSPQNMNEITSTIRQLMPDAKILLVNDQAAIVIRAFPEDMALAERIINDLDRAKKTWRLTYTVTEVDGIKRLGSQHYVMVMAAGQQAVLKQGNKVPIATGSYAARDASSHETVMSYQDVGMNFDATLTEIQGGARLRSDISQTSVADDKAASVSQDPILRQATLRSEAILSPGKPLVLGSMDIPGSTRHLEIEALMEPLP